MKRLNGFQNRLFSILTMGLIFTVTFPVLAQGEVKPVHKFPNVKWGAALSPDGTKVATGDYGGKVWDAATRELLAVLEAPMGYSTTAMAFSPNAQYVFIGDEWGYVTAWDVQTKEVLRSIDPYEDIRSDPDFHKWVLGVGSLALSPDGKYLAVGAGAVRIYDFQSGEKILTIGLHKAARYMAFFPDSKRILVQATVRNEEGSNIDEEGQVRDIPTGDAVVKFNGSGAILSADGRRVVTDRSRRHGYRYTLWDAETGEEIASFPKIDRQAGLVAISPDGTAIILRNSTKSITTFLDVRTRTQEVLPQLAEFGQPISPHQAFSADGNLLLTVRGGMAYLWDISDLRAGVRGATKQYNAKE